jgi:hypothetical protein
MRRKAKGARQEREQAPVRIGVSQGGESHRFDRVKKTRHTPASLLIANNLRALAKSKPAKAGAAVSQVCNLVCQKSGMREKQA